MFRAPCFVLSSVAFVLALSVQMASCKSRNFSEKQNNSGLRSATGASWDWKSLLTDSAEFQNGEMPQRAFHNSLVANFTNADQYNFTSIYAEDGILSVPDSTGKLQQMVVSKGEKPSPEAITALGPMKILDREKLFPE